MKTKHLIIAFLSIILISVLDCATASAQSDINRIVDELESRGADVNKVVKRNKKTKKIYLEVKSVSFLSKGDIYARQLKAAFEKDSKDCDNVTTNRNGSDKLDINMTLIFRDNKSKSIYCLTISGNRTPHSVAVSIIYKDEANEYNSNDDSYIINNGQGLQWEADKFAWNDTPITLNLNKIDWSQLDKKMKQLGDINSMVQLGNAMRQYRYIK